MILRRPKHVPSKGHIGIRGRETLRPSNHIRQIRPGHRILLLKRLVWYRENIQKDVFRCEFNHSPFIIRDLVEWGILHGHLRCLLECVVDACSDGGVGVCSVVGEVEGKDGVRDGVSVAVGWWVWWETGEVTVSGTRTGQVVPLLIRLRLTLLEWHWRWFQSRQWWYSCASLHWEE